MKIIGVIGDAVFASKLPDEELTLIKSGELKMVLGRVTSAKLAGISFIGGDGKIILPDEKKAFEPSIDGTRFVDAQV